MITRTVLVGTALLWMAAVFVLWNELPEPPSETIGVEASGAYVERIDSARVILDHPDHPTDARVVVWIDGVPASCVSTDQGQRGWVEVHPDGFEHAPIAGGRFLEDPDCGITVTLPGGDVDPRAVDLRFAGVLQ